MDDDALADEFAALFISVGTPKINPYASLYLAGFINEKPLVGPARRPGAARAGARPGQREMEDHLGALCEAMRLLVAGGPGHGAQPLAIQQHFFDTHIAPWYGRCLHDIRSAPEANFYRLVADFAQAFFDARGRSLRARRRLRSRLTGADGAHMDQMEHGHRPTHQTNRARSFLRAARGAGRARRAGGRCRRRRGRGCAAAGAAAAAPEAKGYRETEHIQKYYRTARYW